MEENPTIPSEISEIELQQLKQVIREQFAEGSMVLGAKLGELIRSHLTDPNLKTRFGGLKAFLRRHLSPQIQWQGRRGLDDVYQISFLVEAAKRDARKWQPVSLEPSPLLWSTVSNPSIDQQFAWSAQEQSLQYAPPGLELNPGLTVVAKLSKIDYRTIATAFAHTLNVPEISQHVQVTDKSDFYEAFIRLIREQGLSQRWEIFRIDHVLHIFAERLEAAGASRDLAMEWADRLRSSQQQARAQRTKKSPATTLTKDPFHKLTTQNTIALTPDLRTVAKKAMEFLSDLELAELCLPLGAVMSALKSSNFH